MNNRFIIIFIALIALILGTAGDCYEEPTPNKIKPVSFSKTIQHTISDLETSTPIKGIQYEVTISKTRYIELDDGSFEKVVEEKSSENVTSDENGQIVINTSTMQFTTDRDRIDIYYKRKNSASLEGATYFKEIIFSDDEFTNKDQDLKLFSKSKLYESDDNNELNGNRENSKLDLINRSPDDTIYRFVGSDLYGIQIKDTLDSTKTILKSVFKDLDNDGDLDLMMMGISISDTIENPYLSDIKYFIVAQENIGTKWHPEFTNRKAIFENFEFPKGRGSLVAPSVGDINGDGLQDFVVSYETDSSEIQYTLFYLQDNDESFEQSSCKEWGLETFIPHSLFFPELVDLDQDGDLDLLMSGFYPLYIGDDEEERHFTFLYAKNNGTIADPKFLGWFENPYGLDSFSNVILMSSGDFDKDGDIDILTLDEDKDGLVIFNYYENIPNNEGWPDFLKLVTSPFGLPKARNYDESWLFPSVVDIDADGDLDLFLPHIIDTDTSNTFTFDFFENTICDEPIDTILKTICQGDTINFMGKNFMESGTYNISRTNTSGCNALTQLILKVIPTSNVFVNDTLCYGESYTLGDNEYTESGVYELSLLSQSGCDSTIIANLEFIKIDTALSVEGAVLSAHKDDNYTYQWFDCKTDEDIAGATKFEFEPDYSGDFAVRINSFGCEEISECHHVIATGLKSIFTVEDIVLMPNPTKGIIKIRKESELGFDNINLFDQSGRLLQQLGVDMQEIDLTRYENGIYYLTIEVDQERILKKIILLK